MVLSNDDSAVSAMRRDSGDWVSSTRRYVSSTFTAGRTSLNTWPCLTSSNIDGGRKWLNFSDFLRYDVCWPLGNVTVRVKLSLERADSLVTASHSLLPKGLHTPPQCESVLPAAPKSRGTHRSARHAYVAGPAGDGDGGDPPDAATVRVKNSCAIPPTVDSLPGSACCNHHSHLRSRLMVWVRSVSVLQKAWRTLCQVLCICGCTLAYIQTM